MALHLNSEHKTGIFFVEKANQFCVLFGLPATCNECYVSRWRKRNNIVWQGNLHGESASVNPEAVRDWLSKLDDLCANYKDEDVFNTDETGLFYQMELTGTMRFRHENCSGGKQSKTRCTVLLTCSLTGEKLPLLVIGKSKNPRCFKNINRNILGVIYRSNANSWMTGHIYNEYIKVFYFNSILFILFYTFYIFFNILKGTRQQVQSSKS